MANIDQIALDAPRRFTEEADAQRRAQLRVWIAEAIRAAQESFAVVELLDVRNHLHVMATTVLLNFCDVAAQLRGKVQQLIDDHRRSYPEGGRG
jgi:methyl coenzyme M reductase subunit C